MKKLIVYFFLLILVKNGSLFDEFRSNMQDYVIKIADEMAKDKQRCTTGTTNCETLSHNGCIGSSQKQCSYEFPKPVACFSEGAKVPKRSTIKFPPNLNYSALQDEHKRFVCASAGLDESIFKKLDKIREKRYGLAYFGNKDGLFRSFPGQIRGENGVCDNYDPRFRPWYTIAASGTKNVIIIIDNSASMAKNNGSLIAKAAAKSAIQTLSVFDNAAIIILSGDSLVLGKQKKLQKADSTFKKQMIQLIQSLQPFGNTDYQQVFTQAIEMFKNNQNAQNVCHNFRENVVLLLTDGPPTQGQGSDSDVRPLIEKLTNLLQEHKVKMRLFAYPLVSTSKKQQQMQYLRQLSCAFDGIVVPLSTNSGQTNSDYAYKMRQYFTYLSIGANIDRPIWTQPYWDYFGYGEMVTISMPAYYFSDQNVKQLLGVAGIDVVMSKFDQFGMSDQEIRKSLIGQPKCNRNNLSSCDLQSLRGQYRCNIPNCSKVVYQSKCLDNITAKIFQNPIITSQGNCCGVTNVEFALLTSFGILTVIIVAICIYKRRAIVELYRKIQQRRKMLAISQTNEDNHRQQVDGHHESQKSLQNKGQMQEKTVAYGNRHNHFYTHTESHINNY